MHRWTVPVALVALVVGAAPASAKGILEATVCGKNECREVSQMTVAPFLSERPNRALPPATPAPWYRVTIVIGEPGRPGAAPRVRERLTITVVPDRELLLDEDGRWLPMSTDSAAAYRTATAGVEPLPAASMPGAVEAPAAEPAQPQGSRGGPPAWVYVAGGLSLLALTGLALRSRTAAALAQRRMR